MNKSNKAILLWGIKMKYATKITLNDEYSLENFLTLPLNEQAEVYFFLGRELFGRNQGILATKFMAKALSINPDLIIRDRYYHADESD